jgi:AcrR family transcriptional regulator
MSTVRPLRQDAARNRERLVLAAREVFGREGLDAPLEEVARAAGVAIGTLYNRFPSRGELVDAALAPLAGEAVAVAERAAGVSDPAVAFDSFMTQTCALFARDRASTGVYRSRVPGTPAITAAQRRLWALKADILARARQAGAVRADVESTDIAILMWGVIGTMDATRDVAPEAWRRHLALLLDGLRPAAAHPLPVPAVAPAQLRDARPLRASG